MPKKRRKKNNPNKQFLAAISTTALPFCFIASSSIAFDLYHESTRVTTVLDNTFDDFDLVPKEKLVSF